MKTLLALPLVLVLLLAPAWLDNNLPTVDFVTPLMDTLGNFLNFLASNK